MGFSHLYFVYFLILIIPLIVILEYVSERQKRNFIKKVFSEENIKKLFLRYDLRIIELKKVLKILGLIFLIFALTGPRFGAKLINIKKHGVDVIIAVDVSRSMLAQDMSPNRMEKAKLELRSLVEKLSGNRIGIIAFAGKPFLQCPLTLDTAAVKIFLDSLGTELIPVPGTAIGEAIKLAVKNFIREERKYKALILLTDGEDHEGDPVSHALTAKKEGVKIFTIGFGTVQGELIPEKDAGGKVVGYKKDKEGETVMTKLAAETLQNIAYETGGKYYQASDGEMEVSLIADDISEMETKQLKAKKYERYEEKFYYFVLIGLILILIEMFLPDSFRRKVNI
ncbi:MAG: VWA domain-containing protein [Elusimicrobia bacterium]|nr:VWA domain-containing protein [Elusimicrobiota bacterium]